MPLLVLLILLITVSSAGFSGFADARMNRHAARTEGHSAVPTLDIESGCRDVTNDGISKTTNYSGCLDEERTARTQLEKEWTTFSGSGKEQCMNLVTPPALPSYVTLQECLTMARDVGKNPGKANPG
jgi:hypothetical protein